MPLINDHGDTRETSCGWEEPLALQGGDPSVHYYKTGSIWTPKIRPEETYSVLELEFQR